MPWASILVGPVDFRLTGELEHRWISRQYCIIQPGFLQGIFSFSFLFSILPISLRRGGEYFCWVKFLSARSAGVYILTRFRFQTVDSIRERIKICSFVPLLSVAILAQGIFLSVFISYNQIHWFELILNINTMSMPALGMDATILSKSLSKTMNVDMTVSSVTSTKTMWGHAQSTPPAWLAARANFGSSAQSV